jgi:selenocysteine lyase/cysteine desulfurase
LHRKFQFPATTRVSVSIYTTEQDIEHLITAVKAAVKKLRL